jgi:hypothetical protein
MINSLKDLNEANRRTHDSVKISVGSSYKNDPNGVTRRVTKITKFPNGEPDVQYAWQSAGSTNYTTVEMSEFERWAKYKV